MKKSKRWLIGFISLMFILSHGTVMSAEANSLSGLERLNQVMGLIQQYYLRGGDENELVDAAINGMMASLNDPYSEYLSAEAGGELFDQLDGNLYQIGVRFELDERGIMINQINVSSPAEKAGLQVGDYLILINNNNVNADNLAALLYEARGMKEGDRITVTIQRKLETLTYSIPYAKVEIPLVHGQLLSDLTGYLELMVFSERAVKAFTQTLEELKAQGMRSLIINLRNNGGGDVESARQLAKLFIKEGVMMYTLNNSGKETAERIEGGSELGLPMAILVNNNTASAAEILTGALQDYKLATVIGTATFGKGIMQSLFPLLDGTSMLKITTDEYITPLRHKVQDTGIIPDQQVSGELEPFLKGLHTIGTGQIQMEIKPRSLSINRLELASIVPFKRQDGKVFLPSRLIAAVLNTRLEWNEATQSVRWIIHDYDVSYSVTNGDILLEDGISYIDLDDIRDTFPSFTWRDHGDSIYLETSG